jgi:hypothetical protein
VAQAQQPEGDRREARAVRSRSPRGLKPASVALGSPRAETTRPRMSLAAQEAGPAEPEAERGDVPARLAKQDGRTATVNPARAS